MIQHEGSTLDLNPESWIIYQLTKYTQFAFLYTQFSIKVTDALPKQALVSDRGIEVGLQGVPKLVLTGIHIQTYSWGHSGRELMTPVVGTITAM